MRGKKRDFISTLIFPFNYALVLFPVKGIYKTEICKTYCFYQIVLCYLTKCNVFNNFKTKKMKTKKLSTLLVGLLLIIANTLPVKAQEKKPEPETKIQKYEVAIDFQNFSYPEKVFFKINNIKDDKIKGAYRFGIEAKFYGDKAKRAENIDGNKEYELIKNSNFTDFHLLFGYEKQHAYNNVVLYYGADFSGGIHFVKEDQHMYSVNFIPFVGVKTFLSKSISIAFEAGIHNYFSYEAPLEQPEGTFTKKFYYGTIMKLPYSLTLNFNF